MTSTASDVPSRSRATIPVADRRALTPPDEASLVTAFGKPGKAKGDWQDADVTAFWWCMTNWICRRARHA